MDNVTIFGMKHTTDCGILPKQYIHYHLWLQSIHIYDLKLYIYDLKLSCMIPKHTLLMTKHTQISDFEMPNFQDFSLERMKDVISVISSVVLKQLRPSGMLSGPSGPAPRASRLQTTAQNAVYVAIDSCR